MAGVCFENRLMLVKLSLSWIYLRFSINLTHVYNIRFDAIDMKGSDKLKVRQVRILVFPMLVSLLYEKKL